MFQTGNSGVNKAVNIEQVQYIRLAVYIKISYGDNDIGSFLGGSLCFGGANDDAHRSASYRLPQSSPRLARTIHSGSTVALSQYKSGSNRKGELLDFVKRKN